jgi:hypothetical protein
MLKIGVYIPIEWPISTNCNGSKFFILHRLWDKNISMEIIANWLDLMNVNGWIPREQILGKEARR